MQESQEQQKPPSFPMPPKSALFSRLEAFLPVMAEENKKLSEAVAAGQGAKHNIEVEEEESADDEDDAMTGGDGQKEKNGKAPVIQMDFALGTMDEGDGDSDSGAEATATDPEAQIKAAIAAKEVSALSGSKREEGEEASPFQMRTEKSSSKPRPVIQELN